MTFPDGFLWGAGTSAHQTEGNNTGSDWWAMEHGHLPSPRPLDMPSGDAADSYHRFTEDMKLLSDAGLTAYRFSIEWARIEPEPGFVSRAQIDHYRRMVDASVEFGLTPIVTLHHLTNPVWFTRDVGWHDPRAVDFFGRYAQLVVPVLEHVEYVCTINEPNIIAMKANTEAGTDAGDVPQGLPAGDPLVTEHLISAHQLASAIARGAGSKAGWSVATQAFQAEPGAEEFATEYGRSREDVFLDAAAGDDWIGVQAYTRTRLGVNGPLPIADDAERTLTGWEYYPQALEQGIRRSWERNGVPIIVTENGIATADDARRIDYTRTAIQGLQRTVDDGIDVRGYLHWSALDNYEWGSYTPTFGLIGWNAETFERLPKPSLAWLGGVSRAHGLSAADAALADSGPVDSARVASGVTEATPGEQEQAEQELAEQAPGDLVWAVPTVLAPVWTAGDAAAQSAPEPTAEPDAEPTAEPDAEPTAEPTAEPSAASDDLAEIVSEAEVTRGATWPFALPDGDDTGADTDIPVGESVFAESSPELETVIESVPEPETESPAVGYIDEEPVVEPGLDDSGTWSLDLPESDDRTRG